MLYHTLARRTLSSELRALLAVARKEWTIFLRYPSWVFALLIWPVLFPFGYIFTARALAGPDGAALGAFGAATGTLDYISYIAIGSTIYMWFNITLWEMGFFLRNEQMRGTLESNWLAPVWRLSLVLGGGLIKMVTALFFIAVTVVEFRLFFGVTLLRGDPALLVLILVLLIACIYGFGIAFGSLVLHFQEANAMVFLVRGVVMIFCGITFPLAVLPDWMRQVAAWIPLTYGIRAIRAVALNGATLADVLPDLLRLAGFALVIPVLGFLVFRTVERRARRRGTLGQY